LKPDNVNDAYDKIGYFVGELMVKLNEYGKRRKKAMKKRILLLFLEE
jgi:hypothetical protein